MGIQKADVQIPNRKTTKNRLPRSCSKFKGISVI